MKRLKIILRSNYFYLIIFIFLSLYVIYFTNIKKYKSVYQDNPNIITGEITQIKNYSDKTVYIIKAKEKVIATLYEKNESFNEGDIVSLIGQMKTPSSNTIKNTFNYKKYLYNQKIYKTFTISSITLKRKNNNIFYKLKNKLYNHVKDSTYLKLFILGDKSSLDNDIYDNYKNIGVAHLLAISGMHISVFVIILEKLLKYIRNNLKYKLIIFILLIYSLIVGSASIMRVVIFYTLGKINKKYNLNISQLKILLLTAFILILSNPFYFYDVGFRYSFLCTFGIIFSKKTLKKNYFINLIIISYITLLFTLPVTINLNYEINSILFLANLILIPYISFFLYPLSIITFIIPKLGIIFNFFTRTLELIVTSLSKIKIFTIIIPRISALEIIIYYLLVILYVYFYKKRYLILMFIMLSFIKLKIYLNNFLNIVYLDVGQGDSTLINYKSNVILLDTGGNINYDISKNSLSYLKSMGLSKINYLIITHGDYDHMGETINLVENFKVENVIFNCGTFNDLEQELIKVLAKKKIKYYSCIKELNIDKYKLQFLNTKEYDNENDNSNVIYFNYNNYKFLFMGDAGIEKEKDILEKYNLKDIDFLKVGHHGSNTSSSKYFIDNINPKYSLISVGKNNRYGHPKDEVLDTLKNSHIYRTDLDGSIEIKLNKNEYKIRTCPP